VDDTPLGNIETFWFYWSQHIDFMCQLYIIIILIVPPLLQFSQ